MDKLQIYDSTIMFKNQDDLTNEKINKILLENKNIRYLHIKNCILENNILIENIPEVHSIYLDDVDGFGVVYSNTINFAYINSSNNIAILAKNLKTLIVNNSNITDETIYKRYRKLKYLVIENCPELKGI